MNAAQTDPTPLYARLEASIAADILGGVLSPGCQLPTEDELIGRFGVSRTTVRKAVQNLISRGLVEVRRGTGTFVTQPKFAHDLTRLSGFVEDMEALGRVASARLLGSSEVQADGIVARQLSIGEGSPVVRIERVRFADGIAISFDETFLPLEIGRKIAADDLESIPIFTLLEETYHIPLVEAEYQMEAAGAPTDVAAALGIEPGSPIFLIERTSYSSNNRPVDYERLSYRGDLVRFRTRLTRQPASAG